MEQQVFDRVATRSWSLDLSLVSAVRPRKTRPTSVGQQDIARFVNRSGDVEHFIIRQTVPYPGYEAEHTPSQAQHGAVADFYEESCETPFQANTMLSARDYAQVIAKNFSFTTERMRFIAICTAAFILADKDLRSRVRSWNIRSRSHGYTDISVGIRSHKPYDTIAAFTRNLVTDIRGEGSGLFG